MMLECQSMSNKCTNAIISYKFYLVLLRCTHKMYILTKHIHVHCLTQCSLLAYYRKAKFILLGEMAAPPFESNARVKAPNLSEQPVRNPSVAEDFVFMGDLIFFGMTKIPYMFVINSEHLGETLGKQV